MGGGSRFKLIKPRDLVMGTKGLVMNSKGLVLGNKGLVPWMQGEGSKTEPDEIMRWPCEVLI